MMQTTRPLMSVRVAQLVAHATTADPHERQRALVQASLLIRPATAAAPRKTA